MVYLKQFVYDTLRFYKELLISRVLANILLYLVSVDKMEFCTILKAEFLVFEMEIS